MKYRLKFHCEKPIKLPIHYHKILQAALLHWIDEEEGYSQFLHDEGFANEAKKYKLFTFSNIQGNHTYHNINKTLVFYDDIHIILSFYTEESHKYILKNIKENKAIRFGNTFVEFVECGIAEEEYKDCVVDTVSPITVHTTLHSSDGKKFTHYYEPGEKGFQESIANNLLHKIEAIHGKKPEDARFSITPYRGRPQKRILTKYGGLVIKGWQGSFEIGGSPEMVKMALLSGIGDRNSIGFGCVLQNQYYTQKRFQ